MVGDQLENYRKGLRGEFALTDPRGLFFRALFQGFYRVTVPDNRTLEQPDTQEEPYKTLARLRKKPVPGLKLHESIPGFEASDAQEFVSKVRKWRSCHLDHFDHFDFEHFEQAGDLLRLRSDFCRFVGEPLQRKRFVSDIGYHVSRPYPHSERIAARIEDLSKIGPLVDKWSLRNLAFADFWLQSLISCQEDQDLPPWEPKFYGASFYSSYAHGDKQHPRFRGKPGNTVSNMHKAFRDEFVSMFNQETKIQLYTFDFSDCHPRILEHMIDQGEGPLLHQSVTEKGFWDTLAHQFGKDHGGLSAIGPERLAEIIKTSTLAILNGGTLGGIHHFKSFLEGETDDNGRPLMDYAPTIKSGLAALPISKEFMRLRKTLHVDGESFLMSSPKPYVNREKPDTNASFVLSSGEMTGLTYLIEFLATTKKPLVPLALEHNGVLVACTESIDDSEKIQLSEQFNRFFWSATGIHLPIEIVKVGKAHLLA